VTSDLVQDGVLK